jgi:transporter family-2 protein
MEDGVIGLLVLTALAAGMLLPVQAGINAQLRTAVGHPIPAAMIQFAVAMIALLVVFFAVRAPVPDTNQLASAKWWMWIGGLFGANYIVVTILLAPRLGASTMLAVIFAGQMIVSLVLDHFGWIGYPTHPVSLWRVAGAILLLVGMGLIQRF